MLRFYISASFLFPVVNFLLCSFFIHRIRYGAYIIPTMHTLLFLGFGVNSEYFDDDGSSLLPYIYMSYFISCIIYNHRHNKYAQELLFYSAIIFGTLFNLLLMFWGIGFITHFPAEWNS